MTSRNNGRVQLATRVLIRLVIAFITLPALLLLAAGTLAYREAWTYLSVLFVCMILTASYLLIKDPALLERRMRMREKDAAQSLIIRLGAVCYVAAFLIPGLDRRFGWSQIPVAAVVVADAMVLLGYGLFILVLRENRYASRIIEVEPGQRLVTTGPYAIVRHPMYTGILVMFLFTPVALGSWWGLIPALALMAVLVARIRNEEQLLCRELEGYRNYVQTTRYRLVPGLW